MKNFTFFKILPILIAIAAFVVLSFAYFTPAVFEEGTRSTRFIVLDRDKSRDYMGVIMAKRTRWINSMFCGMPTYQMSPTYNSTKPQDNKKTLLAVFARLRISAFYYLLGFYILMRAFDASPLISALGAILWTFLLIF